LLVSQGHHRNPPLKNLKKKWKFEWSVRIIFKEKIKEINTTSKIHGRDTTSQQ